MPLLEAHDKELEFEEYLWTVAEGAASLAGALLGEEWEWIAGLGKIGTYLDSRKALRGLIGGLEPNPHFVSHQIECASSRTTLKYFAGRAAKSALGTGIGFASKAATAATVVDVGGLAKEGQAVGLPIAHAAKLHAIAQRHGGSATVAAWVALLVKLKGMKAAIRGAGLAGAAIPFGVAGVVADCLQSASKVGVKLKYGNVAARAAMDLHWRAYQEQFFSGKVTGKSSGAVGPASAIMYELFTKRGMTRIFGKYDVDALISEAAGWLALNDKISLI